LTSSQKQFFNGSVAALNSATLDKNKKKKQVKRAIDPSLEDTRTSAADIRKVLKKFAVEFVDNAFNLLMPRVFKTLTSDSKALLQLDRINYFQMIRYDLGAPSLTWYSLFVEFHRLRCEKRERQRGRDLQDLEKKIAEADGERLEILKEERMAVDKQHTTKRDGEDVELIA